MDRQHRRELKHDKFVDEVGVLSGKARANQRLLIAIGVGVIAVALIAYGIIFYRGNKEDQAQAALSLAIEAIDSPLIQPGVPNPQAKFKTEEERTTRTEAMFREVQTKFGGTDAADVANLYLSRIAASKNDVAGARKQLQEFVEDHPSHILVGGARYSLYQLRIDNGEAQQVVAELNQELAKSEGQALPADSLLSLLAHAYDVQGAPDKSKEALRRIITEFPDSPYALEAQRRVGSA